MIPEQDQTFVGYVIVYQNAPTFRGLDQYQTGSGFSHDPREAVLYGKERGMEVVGQIPPPETGFLPAKLMKLFRRSIYSVSP